MKEITRIHLAKTPFNVEIDAKKALEVYLMTIQKAIGADDDTLREIEARIIELLAERNVANDRVITTADVEAIEIKLGSPSDFIDEAEHEDVAHTNEKRLMRNSERGILGGVCAGIADYFGLDVVWIRLGAIVVTLLSFGTAVAVYAVLWLVVPTAKTAADKLQMRGERVTLAALKTESVDATPAIAERSKPLVLVLRLVLGIGFVMAALGGAGLLVAAILVREPLFGVSVRDLPHGGALSLIGAAYGLAIMAGLLFVALMSLAAFSSFAWKLTRTMISTAIIISILGLVTFGAAFGVGVRGVDQYNQKVAELQTSQTAAAPQLQSTKALVVDNNSSISVEYVVSSGPSQIMIEYLKGYHKPHVKITNVDDAVHVVVDDPMKCPNTAERFACLSGIDSVTIYGPALQNLSIQRGDVQYTSNQSSMRLNIANEASATITGSIETLDTTVTDGASLYASDAAVQNVQINLEHNANATFGTVVELKAKVPQACGSGGESSLSYANVERLTINNSAVASTIGNGSSDRAPYNCVLLEHAE